MSKAKITQKKASSRSRARFLMLSV